MTRLQLSGVLDSVVDETTKGMPGGLAPTALREIGGLGWNVLAEDLPLPLMTLRRSALANNLAVMKGFCERHGLLFAPHGKTTMAPQLFDAQLEAGAWAITAASVEQLQVYRSVKVPRIVLANQIVGRPALRYLCAEAAADPGFELYSWVDSAEAVERLTAASEEFGRTTPWLVLLEVGWPGGRTGVRTAEQIASTVAAVRAAGEHVRLVGVSIYEGLLAPTGMSAADIGASAAVDLDAALAFAVTVAADLHGAGDLPDDYLLSGGGSWTFDAVVRHFAAVPAPVRTLVRPGGYLSHDHLINTRLSPLGTGGRRYDLTEGVLEAALELWTYVQSTPEPGLAFLTAGRRDAPWDAGMPLPLRHISASGGAPLDVADAQVVAMNDQHLYLRHGGGLRAGDRVVLGISHPCTAFDKWQVIPVVDDESNVVDAIRTYF